MSAGFFIKDVHELSEDTGYKNNKQKLFIFPYTSNSVDMIQNIIWNSTQNVKYLGIKLTKYEPELFMENGNTLLRKSLKDLNKCTYINPIVMANYVLQKCKDNLVEKEQSFQNDDKATKYPYVQRWASNHRQN